MASIPWLPSSTVELVDRTTAALQRGLGGALSSAFLVGNAMNPARADRARAPEIVAVAIPPVSLGKLSEELRAPMTAGARVRLLLEDELSSSADVFALEVAEWKARHLVLVGDDPLASITPTRADLRRGIETELRGLTRRARNRVLTGISTDRGRDDPFDGVVGGYDRLLVSAYHTLRLLDVQSSATERAIVLAIAEQCGASSDAFLRELDVIRRGGRFEPLRALEVLLGFAEPLTELVDGLEVGP
jgi:hypothetical protein